MEITKDTLVEDVLRDYPSLSKVFIELGLPCLVCGEAFWGTIDELVRQNNVDANKIVKELNETKQRIDEKL